MTNRPNKPSGGGSSVAYSRGKSIQTHGIDWLIQPASLVREGIGFGVGNSRFTLIVYNSDRELSVELSQI